MPSLSHSFGISYDSDIFGEKKLYEVLNTDYQFKLKFYKLSFLTSVHNMDFNVSKNAT